MSFFILIIILLIIYVLICVVAEQEHKKQDMLSYCKKFNDFFYYYGEIYEILAPYTVKFNTIFIDYVYKNKGNNELFAKIDRFCMEHNINKSYFNWNDKLFESVLYQIIKLYMPQYLSIFAEPITFLEDDAKRIAKKFIQKIHIEIPKNITFKYNVDKSKFIYDFIADYSEGMFAVKKDHKYGFIDENYNVCIPLIYDAVSSFHNQKAIVKIGNEFKFINVEGSISQEFTDYEIKYALLDYLLNIKSDSVHGLNSFKQEERKLLMENESNYDLKIYDKISETFLNRENYNKYKDYKNVKEERKKYFEERRKVSKIQEEKLRTYKFEKTEDGVNIIDKDGYPLLPRFNDYYDVEYFKEDFFIIKKKHSLLAHEYYYGLVDKKGRLILPCDYKYIYEGETYIVIEDYSGKGLFSIISKRVILPCGYKNITDMLCDKELYIVENEIGKCAIYSASKENFITDFIFDEIGYFENWNRNLPVPVKIGGKIGFVNREGEFVTQCIYDHPYLEIAIKNGEWFMRHYYYGEDHPYIDENYIIVYKAGKYGYIDYFGTELIPCVFDKANKFINGYAVVQYENKYGIINEHMNIV